MAFAWVAATCSTAFAVTYTYHYTGTIETFTPPSGISGAITISATGAAGGNSETGIPGSVKSGGRGARITGDFFLGPSDTFNILVGQRGSDGSGHIGAGGGGGSFVWVGVNRLIVAGGGGGASNSQAGGDASTGTDGGAGNPFGGAGGTMGNGGTGGSGTTLGDFHSSGAGGGCGFLSDGTDGTNGSGNGTGGVRPSAGGTAGVPSGGFGGGGGGGTTSAMSAVAGAGGGGGGYGGGGGGGNPPFSNIGAGGGGGSYNFGLNQVYEAPIDTVDGNGVITITYNGPTIPPTSTVTQTPTQTPTITQSPTATPTSTATHTPTSTPTLTVTPTVTLTPTRTVTPTVTLTATQTVTATITSTPTNTPSKHAKIMSGATAGSSTITGESDPTCPCTSAPCDGKIHVFDCGPEKPPVCLNADFEIAAPVTKLPDGTFTVMLAAPLEPGQIIYVTDGCFDPALIGSNVIVAQPRTAPAMSREMVAALIATLSLIGLSRLTRLRAMP